MEHHLTDVVSVQRWRQRHFRALVAPAHKKAGPFCWWRDQKTILEKINISRERPIVYYVKKCWMTEKTCQTDMVYVICWISVLLKPQIITKEKKKNTDTSLNQPGSHFVPQSSPLKNSMLFLSINLWLEHRLYFKTHWK